MKKSMNKTAQAGFTLIELIVVIVILGILAATALPKFVNMGSDARFASLKGVQGGINSAVALAHSQALVKNQTGATDTISMDGASVATVYGYPAASTTGLATAAGIDGYQVVNYALTQSTASYAGPALNNPATAGNAVQLAFVPNGVDLTTANAAKCAVVYTEAKMTGTAPNQTLVAPTVTSTATSSADCQ